MSARAVRFEWVACLLFVSLLVLPGRAQPVPMITNQWVFWFHSGMFADDCLSSPAVAPDGTIYVGAFSGILHALTPDGKERWRFQAGDEIKSSPAIADDGTIYFGNRDRNFYAVTPDGKLKWKFPTGAWVDSSPGIAADGTIYFGSWDGNFYALNPDGSLKWKFPVGAIVDSSPAIAGDGTIYFGAHDKKFYALNPAGQPLWTFPTGAEITSSPAIGQDGSLYFGSTDGLLYHLKSDGSEIWHCRIGGGSDSSPVLADNGNVVIGAGQRTVIVSPAGAISSFTGGNAFIDVTGAVAQGTVCVSVPWRQMWALKPDGRLLWQVLLLDNLTGSPVIANNGQIYCCCARHVEAIQPPVALSPAKSSWPMFRANARHTGRVNPN